MSVEHPPVVANIAVALAAALALFAYAGGLANPAAAAETHFLALWVTSVLLTLAGLALAPAFDLAVVAVLVTTTIWVVPHGPTRGAAVGLLLTLAFAFIGIRRVDRAVGPLGWSWAILSSLALQFLCRADRFLDPSPDSSLLIGVFTLPLLAAAAFQWLQEREGVLQALLAAMTCALLVPGWSVTVVLSLLAVVAAIFWRDQIVRRWLVIVLAGAIVVAGYLWQPSLVWLLLLTMIAKSIPASWKTGSLAVIVTAVLLIFLPEARSWSEVLGLMALGPILLPALLLPSDSRRAASIQAFVLAVLALRTVAGPGALAAPLALAALSLRGSAVAARFQIAWTGILLGCTTVLGTYPWLRSPALEDALGLFGIDIGWLHAVGVVFTLWLLTFICAARTMRGDQLRCRPVLMIGLVLAVLAWIALPSIAEQPFGNRVQLLGETESSEAVDLETPATTSSVVIDTYLENAASLPTGTPVARIQLVGDDGTHLNWLLRAGVDTGEWAARREDVAAVEGFQAPAHWLAWVTASGDLMAQRYRARWQLDHPITVARVEIERLNDLPPEIRVAVFHLELRR